MTDVETKKAMGHIHSFMDRMSPQSKVNSNYLLSPVFSINHLNTSKFLAITLRVRREMACMRLKN